MLDYQRIPTRSLIIRDTYAYRCQSPRPCEPGQDCDGSTIACVYHFYSQLCALFTIDPLELYNAFYPDRSLTQEQFDALLAFAEWQGVEIIEDWSQQKIELVIENIRNIGLGDLVPELAEKTWVY